MQTTLLITQVVSGLLLSLSILIQEKGAGLGEAISGSASMSFQTQKRGAERVLSNITILLLIVFVGVSLALNII